MSLRKTKHGEMSPVAQISSRQRSLSQENVKKRCVCVCEAVGLSHILETGMVCEHEARQMPRGGLGLVGVGYGWNRECAKEGSGSLIPSRSGGKGLVSEKNCRGPSMATR